jgi:glycerol-3-phosphate dehydrogenase
VREALAERAILLRIAPHIVNPLQFVVPCFRWTERLFMGCGLSLYQLLAGRDGLGEVQRLSASQTCALLPGVTRNKLQGGVSYWDAQFDDARLAVALMQTAVSLGAVPLNYVTCSGIELKNGRVAAVLAEDAETGEPFRLPTRCVFNAAGVWVDRIRRMANADALAVVRASQGTHLVLDAHWCPGRAALLIPRTVDGRVLFVVPWMDRLLVGTTDTQRDNLPWEPVATDEEVGFLLRTAGAYLERSPRREDVIQTFTGLRPLHASTLSGATSAVSREHAVLVENDGLVSVVGGKWTTYRRMAGDALHAAARAGVLPPGLSQTADLTLVADLALAQHAHQTASPEFEQYCRRYTQARTVDDIYFRRSRRALLHR